MKQNVITKREKYFKTKTKYIERNIKEYLNYAKRNTLFRRNLKQSLLQTKTKI